MESGGLANAFGNGVTFPFVVIYLHNVRGLSSVGGFVLDHAPLALWPGAAAVCLIGGVGALMLERRIPPGLRLTPA
jgi:hypothetical protein